MNARTAQPMSTHGYVKCSAGHDRVEYPDTRSRLLTTVPYGPGSPGDRSPVRPMPFADTASRTPSLHRPVHPTGAQAPRPSRWENDRA